MLRRFSFVGLLLGGILLVVRPAAAAQIGFSLTEVNDTTLTSSLAGVVITNTALDTWTVNLGPAGITGLNNGFSFAWAEPGSATTVNFLHPIAGTLSYQLQSDFPIANLPSGDNFCGTSSPLTDGVTCLVGTNADNQYFATVLDQGDAPAAVPEPASMLLVGTGLIGFAARRRRNRR